MNFTDSKKNICSHCNNIIQDDQIKNPVEAVPDPVQSPKDKPKFKITKLISTPTNQLTNEEREYKLAYFRKYNSRDAHKKAALKYYNRRKQPLSDTKDQEIKNENENIHNTNDDNFGDPVNMDKLIQIVNQKKKGISTKSRSPVSQNSVIS